MPPIRAPLSLLLTLASLALSAGVLPSAAQDVLFAEGQNPDLRVEVRDLKRGDDGTVTLRLRLVNESDEDFDASCEMRESGGDSCGVFSGAYLIDATNQKKYLVVRDSEQVCICSSVDTVAAGKRMNVWATYPAPPADVTAISVIVPLFEPIEDVPISGP
jgi:hypothetical protein